MGFGVEEKICDGIGGEPTVGLCFAILAPISDFDYEKNTSLPMPLSMYPVVHLVKTIFKLIKRLPHALGTYGAQSYD